MGNPAGDRAKKRAKLRKKHEQRLGIGRHSPKTKQTAPAKAAGK